MRKKEKKNKRKSNKIIKYLDKYKIKIIIINNKQYKESEINKHGNLH